MPLNHDIFSQILEIRWLVLRLGQEGTGKWWSTSFLTPAGERFLATPFPRSAFWAGLHASAAVACRHHDGRIGTGGTVHLFRLDREIEVQLRNRVLRDGWRPATAQDSDPVALLDALAGLAMDRTSSSSEGPVRISDVRRFIHSKTLGILAGLYATACERGHQILPYGSDE